MQLFLYPHRLPVRGRDSLQSRCLLFSASQRNVACVQVLLEHGARADHQIYTGDTALHGAVEQARADIVTSLLEHGADMSIRNEPGLTPVFVAAHFGHHECLLALVQHAQSKGTWFNFEGKFVIFRDCNMYTSKAATKWSDTAWLLNKGGCLKQVS